MILEKFEKMKTRLLIIFGIVIGFSVLLLLFLFENPSESNMTEGREDLKEVVYSSTDCARYWRLELFAMWKNQTYDYQKDPIFQECFKALENEN